MGNVNIMENILIYSTSTDSKYENNELEQNYIINACIFLFSSTLKSFTHKSPIRNNLYESAILSH